MLTAREQEILAAVGDAILPRGGLPAPSASDVGVPGEVARLLDEQIEDRKVLPVRAALWGIELGALSSNGRRFTRLPLHLRDRHLARMSRSRYRLRSAQIALLKHLVVNTYITSPTIAQSLGYSRDTWLDERAAGIPAPPSRITPIVWPDVTDRIHCDVVVVGSGAGGGPLAAILTEAGLDVVVVEEGGHVEAEHLRKEAPWHRFLELYRDLGLTGTVGRPPIPVPLGRAVGGTTVVNAGTCFRAPGKVLDEWVADFGLEDARPTDLDPIFREVEEAIGIETPADEVLGRNAAIFREGARRLGSEGHALVRNCPDCRGCGESVVGCPLGRKASVQIAWLPRAERAGARILARVRVDRLRHDGVRATGIDATVLDPSGRDTPRGSVHIDAQTVVVCAGAFLTPTLLDRSGIQDPSGQRGRNLQIHPAIGVAAEMGEDVRSWEGVLQSWGVDALMESHGIMIEATAAPPPLTGGQLPFTGQPLKQLIDAGPRMASTGFLIEDSTAGRVRRGPGGMPLATYQLTDGDERRIAHGFAWCAEALLEAGARRVLVARAGQRWATDARDVRRIREEGVPPQVLRISAYHPVGTHRMSADPTLGPSDPWGKVRGIDRLWVADASSLPTCIGVNPQVTIMAFALRTARRILTTH
jgi:choline dehydrogenase-like flavoprotein